MTQDTFADLGVESPIVESLSNAGITHPFPIQALTLPVALTGADIIGQAKTGTGKTLGFGIPLLQRILDGHTREHGRAPRALVVVPTRELAHQVADDLRVASKTLSPSIVTIYGGKDFEPQIRALKEGADVVVGTPGRLLDLYGRRVLNFSHISTAVFDEADEMLDLGFLPDVEKIVAALPARRQTMLFSATMPGQVIALARRYMSHPTHIRATQASDTSTTSVNTKQHVYRAHSMDKTELVGRILRADGRGRTIIFARTKRTADRLADELKDRGFQAQALHGDLNQHLREKALKRFRNGTTDVLVATDVAARGIDIDDVTHVINYQCPEDDKTYVHRIGRTGRAGNTGIAVTLIDWEDVAKWKLINRTLGLDFDDPVETYSTSPHLFSDLNIAKGTKGRMPRAKESDEKGSNSQSPAKNRSGRGSSPKRKPRAQKRPRRRTRGGKPTQRSQTERTQATKADD